MILVWVAVILILAGVVGFLLTKERPSSPMKWEDGRWWQEESGEEDNPNDPQNRQS